MWCILQRDRAHTQIRARTRGPRLASTKGAMALEPHIEKPDESTAFQKFPKILGNHHASTIICDYLRMVGMNADDPNQIEDVMARELKKTLSEELHPSHMLQNMADGLPALGPTFTPLLM